MVYTAMVMIRIKIFQYGKYVDPDIPQWWKNFTRVHGHKYRDQINEALLPWHANFWTRMNADILGFDRYLDFYDEQAHDWFMLRWS